MSGNQGTQDDVEQEQQREHDVPEQVKKQQESQQKQQASQWSVVGARIGKIPLPVTSTVKWGASSFRNNLDRKTRRSPRQR